MLEKPISTRQETEFKEYLEGIGDSIVVVADDEIVKVHDRMIRTLQCSAV